MAHAFGIEIEKDFVRRVLPDTTGQATPEPIAPLG